MSEPAVLTEKLLMQGLDIILYVAPLVEHANILARYGEYERADEKYKEARKLRDKILTQFAKGGEDE